jgi:hypothetical protein
METIVHMGTHVDAPKHFYDDGPGVDEIPLERMTGEGSSFASKIDEKHRSSFHLLQLFKKSGDVPLVYYVFDLLLLDGKDFREQPLSARRKALPNVLKDVRDNIRLSDELRGSKDALIRVAQEFGLEGLGAKRIQRGGAMCDAFLNRL